MLKAVFHAMLIELTLHQFLSNQTYCLTGPGKGCMQISRVLLKESITYMSLKKLKPVLDHVFATHGYPETVTTDNGPPYSSYEMEKYAKAKGFRLTLVTPDDPQCNGFLESFAKVKCKLLHIATSENKDPKTELYNYLLQYHATTHSTTGRSPAELLFNLKLQTKLPQIFTVKH